MLQLTELQKKYGSFWAVNKIDLTVAKGELFGFLGPNGAGKTTTIKMMTGLLNPTYGNIMFDGLDVWKEPIESKRKIGYIPDQPFLYDKLTGREFLYFSGGLYELPLKDLTNNIEEMLDKLKIGNWIDKRTEEYSQGMRQRIAIASAFVHKPELIIVDEPMVGLDPQSALLVKKLFTESANNGVTVFMSTHSLNVVEEICTDVAIIHKGKIIFRDKIDELHKLKMKHDSSIEELFIELTNDE
ncbi:MAG: ABC-2 type transport system ATP-binding protein [Ignavibacteria bacterium]|nr:MAG: ABC-2 type transport system ATP-binding protein [Ignavibacteria bacterium]KAF0160355.1 MAG: ABC-2 type transport system ATP-binding protein [Ignavibacteria bacterium]